MADAATCGGKWQRRRKGNEKTCAPPSFRGRPSLIVQPSIPPPDPGDQGHGFNVALSLIGVGHDQIMTSCTAKAVLLQMSQRCAGTRLSATSVPALEARILPGAILA